MGMLGEWQIKRLVRLGGHVSTFASDPTATTKQAARAFGDVAQYRYLESSGTTIHTTQDDTNIL